MARDLVHWTVIGGRAYYRSRESQLRRGAEQVLSVQVVELPALLLQQQAHLTDDGLGIWGGTVQINDGEREAKDIPIAPTGIRAMVMSYLYELGG